LGVLLACVVGVAWTAAAGAAGNGDFNYVASPPMIQGPKLSAIGPHLPGLGNDCAPLFGVPSPLGCYDPTEIRNAYDIPSTYDGTGQTIIIVDAYGDPNIVQDLAAFDTLFGVPAPPSLTVYPGSATQKAGGPNMAASWALETALDVEWSHAIAPGANLVLIEAPSASGNAVNTVERKIIPKYPGAIVSQSFGIPENMVTGNKGQVKQAHDNYALFESLGDTVLAAAGDDGATLGTSANTADYPASDPLVTGVGGTEGDPFPLGLCPSASTDTCTYGGEQVWNEPATASVPAATGGGPSQLFPVPSYQSGLGLGSRGTPDVSYNSAINGGVLVVTLPFINLVGGTSCGSPQWAGIFALINQARSQASMGPIGFANPALYAIYADGSGARYGSDFHDITVGNNTLAAQPVTGFSAGPGYDLATGLGTPDVANLISDLG
jgi:subtilase family serine protease